MATPDIRVGRLEGWNRILIGLLVFALICYFGNICLNYLFSDIHKLSVTWDPNGEIRLFSASDGPFVVTHLVVRGSNEGEKAVATLPKPLAVIDSAGARLKAEDASKLVWLDIHGKQ